MGQGVSGGVKSGLLALSAGLAAVALAGGSSDVADRANAASTPDGTFPVFRIATDTGIDYLDPGLTYTTEGLGVLWSVYLPLLGYTHAGGVAGATIVPYLAEALPTVSADGRTYTLVLRKGLKYSNGAPVKASDFRAAIERDYRVDSPGVGFFANIVGAARFAKTKKGHISGIVADDATGRITIELTSPQGDFVNVLATEFAAPVPAGSPAKDTSTNPLPSTGPYTIQSYRPGKQIVEVRNRHFSAIALGNNVPAGNPDKIVWDVVGDDSVALARVIAGQDDWDGYHAIPPSKLESVQRKYGAEIRTYMQPNTYYFFMNVRVKPFTSVKVRRAVNYAIDRAALVRLYNGLAEPTENILPPGSPQYRQHDLYPHNLAKGRKLVTQSGFKGMRVTVWTHQFGPDEKATAYLVTVLNSIGFVARERIVNSAVYWATIGNEATKAQIGFADWFQDYPHPLNWFDVLLNGNRITRAYNSDYANFDNAGVNATIDALGDHPRLSTALDRRWAGLDATVMKQAPWAPFLNRRFTDFFNSKVDLTCYVSQVVYGFDYSTICMH